MARTSLSWKGGEGGRGEGEREGGGGRGREGEGEGGRGERGGGEGGRERERGGRGDRRKQGGWEEEGEAGKRVGRHKSGSSGGRLNKLVESRSTVGGLPWDSPPQEFSLTMYTR